MPICTLRVAMEAADGSSTTGDSSGQRREPFVPVKATRSVSGAVCRSVTSILLALIEARPSMAAARSVSSAPLVL